MKITVIYVGATTDKAFAASAAEYEKRIGAFAKFQSVCVKEEKLDDSVNVSAALLERVLTAEEAAIRAAVPKGAYTAALCVEGQTLSSEELASVLSDRALEGVSSFCFIIGGSHGLSRALKDGCDTRISMSPMTFPHMLARVMLCEQLYRAFCIINGKKYHK